MRTQAQEIANADLTQMSKRVNQYYQSHKTPLTQAVKRHLKTDCNNAMLIPAAYQAMFECRLDFDKWDQLAVKFLAELLARMESTPAAYKRAMQASYDKIAAQ